MVSIDRLQLAIIERWPAYTVVSIDRFQLAVIGDLLIQWSL